MDEIEKKARELLAAELNPFDARQIRQGHTPARCVAALRAVIAALSAALEQHHRDSAELRRLCAERDQQRADKLEMAAEAALWAEEAGRLKALLHDAKSVPDGWVLVPVEPTVQLNKGPHIRWYVTGRIYDTKSNTPRNAGAHPGSRDICTEEEAKAIWKAMLAAKLEQP